MKILESWATPNWSKRSVGQVESRSQIPNPKSQILNPQSQIPNSKSSIPIPRSQVPDSKSQNM